MVQKEEFEVKNLKSDTLLETKQRLVDQQRNSAIDFSVHSQVIPAPSHTFKTISRPFSPRFPPSFARFHRLANTIPTNPKPEPRAERQWQGRPNTVLAV